LKDFLGNPYTYYDAFNPAARRLYWSQVEQAFEGKSVDAWWVDASEPEVVEGPYPSVAAGVAVAETHMNPTAAGSGARVLNAYALVHAQGIYEGARAAHPDRRVFILTRNGFAGMQRYAAASWSGDITSTWTALARQVPAGLGFAISGMPYWTFDTGGFSVPPRFAHPRRGSPEVDEWRELNARWFEYAAFTPILRVHGQAPKREMWELGGEGSPAYGAELKLDRLRYRLLPYIYTLAGEVTQTGGTIMRPLVMDFPDDARARAIADAYMFGPALLVAPVAAYRARARDVYLPPTAGGWYDLWTGAAVAPGIRRAPAPYDAIPVHVRAGSIVPVGPALAWSDEKPADPITLWVYAGADGTFSLYEDDGGSTAYERGAFTRIPLRWNDAARTLTIGRREGAFPGMLPRRTFEVVVVSPRAPAPFLAASGAPRTVAYAGDPIEVRVD
jgi:alpha-D-xyloside xylohydrolase